MKYLPLILNAILFLLVGWLIMDRNSAKEGPAVVEESAEIPPIVYINSDSLIKNYKEFQVIAKEMEAREKREDSALKSRGRSLERDGASLQQEVVTLQNDAQGGNLSRVDYEARATKLAEKEQRLVAKQQKLLADQQKIANELIAEGSRINDSLQLVIRDKLENLKAQKGYEFILSYGPGSGVLVADPKYDITNLVLDILNSEN